MLAASVALAADGDLDATFGIGGKVTTDIPGGPHQLVQQSDGKLVAAGSYRVSFPGGGGFGVAPQFGLARYDANGVLDPTFGDGGIVVAVSNPVQVSQGVPAESVAVLPDGKLLAASDAGAVLMRFLPDGTLDAGFGDGGRVERESVAWSGRVAVQPTPGFW